MYTVEVGLCRAEIDLHEKEESFVQSERGEVDAGRTSHLGLHPDAVGMQSTGIWRKSLQ